MFRNVPPIPDPRSAYTYISLYANDLTATLLTRHLVET